MKSKQAEILFSNYGCSVTKWFRQTIPSSKNNGVQPKKVKLLLLHALRMVRASHIE
jgi:hypothetical protein